MKYFFAISLLFLARVCSAQCGDERWNVKTLTDPDTAFLKNPVVISTVTLQTQLPKIKVGLDDPRKGLESSVYSIDAYVVKYVRETDGDWHIVLKDLNTDSTMVAEIPNPLCSELVGTRQAALFDSARRWFTAHVGNPTTGFKNAPANTVVRVTGVGYYDILHGQTGMASNGREIHPVLALEEATSLDVTNQHPLIAQLSLTPNPAAKEIRGQVQVLAPEAIVVARVIDYAGREICKIVPDGSDVHNWTFHVPVDTLANGTYFVQIMTTTGMLGKQFIIQR